MHPYYAFDGEGNLSWLWLVALGFAIWMLGRMLVKLGLLDSGNIDGWAKGVAICGGVFMRQLLTQKAASALFWQLSGRLF